MRWSWAKAAAAAPRTPAPSGHADTPGVVSAGNTQQVLFADEPLRMHAGRCGGGAEVSMDDGANFRDESPGVDRVFVFYYMIHERNQSNNDVLFIMVLQYDSAE